VLFPVSFHVPPVIETAVLFATLLSWMEPEISLFLFPVSVSV
jgi:hypothetical protein